MLLQRTWVDVGPADALGPGEMMRLGWEPPVAVYNVDGDFHATAETCTHEVAPLTEGYLDGAVVECVFHFAKFCVRTGQALSLPATDALAVYAVEVRDDRLLVSSQPISPAGPGTAE